MSADIPYLEIGEAEPVVLAIVDTKTVFRNAITTVTAALLPGAVLGLPAMCTRTLPGDLLLADLSRAPSLRGPAVLLLTLLPLLILLPSGLLLLLLSGGVGLLLLLLTLLPLLVLLAPGLPLFCGVVLLLTLLALLILLAPGLLLFCGIVLLLALLPLLILLPARLLFRGVVLWLALALLILLLPFRLCRLLLFRRFILFFLFVRLVLPRARRSGDPEHQKKRCRNDVSNWFHFLSPLNFLLKPPRVLRRGDCQAHVSFTGKTPC